MTKKHFPNGFSCWQETHYNIVESITEEWIKDDPKSRVVKTICEKGRGGLYELAEDLTDKFEAKFQGVEWGVELEFLDEMENFLDAELLGTEH